MKRQERQRGKRRHREKRAWNRCLASTKQGGLRMGRNRLPWDETPGLQGDPTSPFWRSALGVLWKEWCWSWNSSTLATSCEELTHWKRLWCWEGLGAGGEVDDRGWDGWMASLTRWMWVWVNSRSWWWTGRPGVLWFMGSQRVGHDWATELNWTGWDREGFSPRAVRDYVALLKSWFWTSSLQNNKTIHFCCFKTSQFCYFIVAALRNK